MRGGGSELSCDALMREVLAPSSIDTERLHSGELVADGEAVCECKIPQSTRHLVVHDQHKNKPGDGCWQFAKNVSSK